VLLITCRIRFSTTLAQVLSNLVNYKSFGFTKIIPRVPEDKLEAVVKHSLNAAKSLDLWNKVLDPNQDLLDAHPS
jgi:dipeptidyl-peptidase-3